jgi:SpoVK/Ycf46/Vps4 family AAA+-type ATPase
VASPYNNNLEYILDELLLLDYKLGYRVMQFKEGANSSNNKDGEYSGLYVSETDVANSLGKKPSENSSSNKFQQAQGTIILKTKEISKRKAMSLKKGIILELPRFSDNLKLSPFETDIILFCLAPQVDSKYERIYAYLHNDVTKKRPTMELILDSLCSSIAEKIACRKYFEPLSVLFRLKVLNTETLQSPVGLLHHLSAPLILDRCIVDLSLGRNELNPAINDFSMLVDSNKKEGKDTAGSSTTILDTLEKNIASTIYTTFKSVIKKIIRTDSISLNDQNREDQSLIFYFHGPKGIGKKTLAIQVCKDLGKSIIIADLHQMQFSKSFDEALLLLYREALIRDAATVYLDGLDRLATRIPDIQQQESEKTESISDHEAGITSERLFSIIKTIKSFSNVVTILAGENPVNFAFLPVKINPLSFIFPMPSAQSRRKLWKALVKQYDISSDVDIDDLANRFRLTQGKIKNAIADARNLSLLRDLGEDRDNDNKDKGIDTPDSFHLKSLFTSRIKPSDLYAGCRNQSNDKLNSLARKINPRYLLDDLILPDTKKAQLKEILSFVKYRDAVYDEWGFGNKLSLGKGLNILFAGESGTGKTMAAEIIANELNLDLYKIDLSSIESKWVGETEKNLDRVFREAETSNAIIFLDECEALLGKRVEQKQANDKFANTQINYLLQKLDEHEEIVILTSNLAKEIDKAFVRRIQFWVEFPFPNEADRLKVWQQIFPKDTPISDDLDFNFLAKQFQVSGGLIKNIAVASAFKAKEVDSEKVTMEHIIKATKREFDKIGKPCLPEEFGKYYEIVTS